VEHLIESAGLGVLFLLIALESMGIPLPGETALIGASVLADHGKFEIWQVIVIAASAAIIGDNLGYWIGRHWGRQLLTKWKRLERFSQRVLPPAERFFAAHGGKTVFFGRFIAFLRITSAWIAGVSHMPWWRFLLWNAAGGIIWATGVSLLAYYAGRAVADAFDRWGVIGAGVLVAVGAVVLLSIHFWRKRVVPEKA
jgi:membrane protein DedA with SNARE-associated domain